MESIHSGSDYSKLDTNVSETPQTKIPDLLVEELILEDDSTPDIIESDGDEFIADISDREDYTESENYKLLKSAINIDISSVEGMKLTPAMAFLMFADRGDEDFQDVEDYITEIIAKMDSKKMEAIMKKINDKAGKKTLILIKKGLPTEDIIKYIIQIGNELKKRPTIHINCPDWKDDKLPYPMINACKKLMTKYCENGLLGCLIDAGYVKEAQEVYCCAYVKCDLVGDKIVFKKIDPDHYKSVLMQSTKTYWEHIDKK